MADATAKGGQVGFHLVNLETGADSPVTFAPVRDEAGTFSIVFDANGCIWTTSTFRNSGGLWPLRRYNPATKETAIISKVGQDTMLTTTADRKFIAYADGYATPSTYGRFSCDAATLPPPLHAIMPLYEIGVSRDGTQLALPSYTGVILSGAGPEKLDLNEALGAAYHPSRDYVFVVRADGTKVTVLETAHYTPVKELDLGTKFGWIGNHPFQEGRLRLSSDGKYVFCTAPGGIRYAETGLF